MPEPLLAQSLSIFDRPAPARLYVVASVAVIAKLFAAIPQYSGRYAMNLGTFTGDLDIAGLESIPVLGLGGKDKQLQPQVFSDLFSPYIHSTKRAMATGYSSYARLAKNQVNYVHGLSSSLRRELQFLATDDTNDALGLGGLEFRVDHAVAYLAEDNCFT